MLRSSLLFASLVMATSAMANSVDFSTQMRGLGGKIAMDCKEQSDPSKGCDKMGPVTLGEMAATALSAPERGLSIDVQTKRGMLANKIYGAKNLDMTVEEIATIKEAIGKMGASPVVVTNAIELLDPASLKK